MKRFPVICFSCLMILFGCSLKKNLKDDLDSLVNAERGFARMSEEKGIQRAFLSHLSEESIVFRPGPVKGKPVYSEPDTISGFLKWKPVFADVSLDGNLGYTTGPWEYRRNSPGDEPVSYGHYVSLWEKQYSGTWKVMLDAGINYSGPDTTVNDLEYAELYRNLSLSVKNQEASKLSLADFEKDYIEEIAAAGISRAFSDFSIDGVRLYRNGFFPMTIKSDILKYLSEENRIIDSALMSTRVSDSVELGYTFGVDSFRSKEDPFSQIEKFAFLRIWKRQENDNWKIVLDLSTIIPDKTTK